MNVGIVIIIYSITMMFIIVNNKQLRNYNNELKKEIVKEKIGQTLIKQQEKMIKTCFIIYNKTLDCATRSFIPDSDYTFMKENIAKNVAQYIIENNLIRIEEFDTYYQCSVDFVKA